MDIVAIKQDVDIKVTQGSILFNDYEKHLGQAKKIAEIIKSSVVTEETVKENKKMLAAANKVIRAVEEKRKEIKFFINEPYLELERQMKDITSVIKEAEQVAREKVNELDEKEREEKRLALLSEWESRIHHYPFNDFIGFDRWLKPNHLNKSSSFNKTIDEMVEWLEKTKKEWVLASEEENLLLEYVETLDLAEAMLNVKKRQDEKERLSTVAKNKEVIFERTERVAFVVELKDMDEVKILLEKNNIEYDVESV